jgi:tetratricopeptide (TPR) repeat protein
LLREIPGQRDARLFRAVAQRYTGRPAEALKTLATLDAQHPLFSRLHEERGHCFVAMKQAPPAIAAFERAVAINFALPSSWTMLEGLYCLTREPGKAEFAARQSAGLREIPQEIVTASGLFADGDLDASESMVRAHLLRHDEHERALELYRELLAQSPQDADLHLSMAHAQKTLGRSGEAIESYRRAAACRPDFGDAYWSLANRNTYRFTDEEFARMCALQAEPATQLVDRYHLCFALGKALEDRGGFAESFR